MRAADEPAGWWFGLLYPELGDRRETSIHQPADSDQHDCRRANEGLRGQQRPGAVGANASLLPACQAISD